MVRLDTVVNPFWRWGEAVIQFDAVRAALGLVEACHSPKH